MERTVLIEIHEEQRRGRQRKLGHLPGTRGWKEVYKEGKILYGSLSESKIDLKSEVDLLV